MKYIATTLAPILMLISHQTQASEYDCVMTIQSTVAGNYNLADHKYRIRKALDGYELSQRMADGSWMIYGIYQESKAEEFDVFTQLTNSVDDAPLVSMFSVHASGNAALVTHHGSWGNTEQYEKAWLIQGTCKAISAN